MNNNSMNGRERILATIRHEEPDRVPVSPRISAWLVSEYNDMSLEAHLKHLPDMDMMHIISGNTPNYLDAYPDVYDLPEVRVEQSKSTDGEYTVVERTFHTPAGSLSDVTRIPPAGREYGVFPNPVKTEYLVKSSDDLDALRYLIPEVGTDFDHLQKYESLVSDRGVIMVLIRSALDHNAGYARDMQDLMIDYYEDRPFFDALLEIFQQHSLDQMKAALEGGATFIFGSWYFNSLSSGWSPKIFSEVFVPQIRAHTDLAHRYDAYYDYYDDGHLLHSMEQIVGAGVDILETCTPPPVGDFDLKQAKERIGDRVTIKGYIDLLYVVRMGTPELIEKTVRDAMAIGKPGGGFIIGSSDSFREGTPRENIDAYFNACVTYGRYLNEQGRI